MEGISLIEEAGEGEEVISILRNKPFDIVILDITLPGISGLEVLQVVKTHWPDTNVLMLSMHSQEQYMIRALQLGASGYLTKDTASEELLMAIRKISSGGKYISQSLGEAIALYFKKDKHQKLHDALSNREFEILLKLANGKSLLEIGNELFISNKTVSTYRTRLLEKMGFKNNTDLTKYCIENQLL
jgi:DNA-binding NarL/FixJ family response regulator